MLAQYRFVNIGQYWRNNIGQYCENVDIPILARFRLQYHANILNNLTLILFDTQEKFFYRMKYLNQM